MSLETGSFIADLTPTNPISSDPVGQGDDHLRLIKTCLQGTLPNMGSIFGQVRSQDTAVSLSSAWNSNTIFSTNSATSTVVLTLPPAASITNGFTLRFVTGPSANISLLPSGAATVNGGASFAIPERNIAFATYAGSSVWRAGTSPTGESGSFFSSLTVSGAVQFGSTLSVSGAASFNSISVSASAVLAGAVRMDLTLSVSGIATFKSAISVSGVAILNSAVSMNATLTVSGATTLQSTLSVSGAFHAKTTMSVGGAVQLASTVSIGGAATLGTTLTVSGVATMGGLVVAGAATLASTLSVSGAAHFKTTLSVGGATLLGGGAVINGAVSISGGVVLTGLLNTTNGQIQFPATANPSADANTLDDYEEGTWTPALTYSTPGTLVVAYGTQSGQYTKIGRVVHALLGIVTTTHTLGTATGNLIVSNLPFAPNVGPGQAPGKLAWQGITKASYTEVDWTVINGATDTQFIASGSAQTRSNIQAGNTASGTQVTLYGDIVYHI